MAQWIFKTEPSEFGIDDLVKAANATARWDGIRNYQARNFLRDQVHRGDQVWLYHSQCKQVGLVGLATVVKEAYPDPAQWQPESPYFDSKSTTQNPRWFCIDIQHTCTFDRIVTLAEIKAHPDLLDMVLLKQGRLSVQPVTEEQAQILQSLANIPTSC